MPNILTLQLQIEHDVVLARQRTRQLASLLGLKSHEQTSIATAVSEIARNAFQYGGGGKVEFSVQGESPQIFCISIRDQGRGINNLQAILDGHYKSATGMGLGIIGAKRLTDHFEIESSSKGTIVKLGKKLPRHTPLVKEQYLAKITQELVQLYSSSVFEEIQSQNHELLYALEELQLRQAEIEQLNKELEETNRGVVALYAELDDKAEYLQRAYKLKSHFLSDMSHELRTPLNSILSLARLLLDRTDGELTSEQEKQVLFIRKSAEMLSELVNNLLDLAKIEAGKIVVQPSEFSVAEVFGALRGMFRPLVNSDAVTLIFEDATGIPKLNTDEGKVSQILRNFISNALKFTESGEVRIAANLNSENTVTFSVTDTGIGIALEEQERIFEEFYQIQNLTQQRVKGTGLGLPLCRKLAKLLGGNVDVISEVGIGSTFFVTIPLTYSQPTSQLVLPEVSWIVEHNRLPVLIVEDNLETLFIYEKFLEKSIFQVIPARNLDEARRALWEIRPRAVILDLLLEGESTWTFISEIKENSFTKHIPVIVATVVDNRAKAIALGADQFCVKPIEKHWLLDQLNNLVHSPSLEKILIVDDDPTFRYLLRGILANKGYTIIEATNGREGSRKVHDEKPQLIFLDLLMPEQNGFELLQQLKSNPYTQNIPIIVNTSKSLNEEERKYLDQKAIAIISKENYATDNINNLLDKTLTKL